MGLLDWFQTRLQRESMMYKYAFIKGTHVVIEGGKSEADQPFAAGDHYFRLWLVEMFLAKDREWFTGWHPAVHAAINFRFGDQKQLITRVAGSTLLPDLSSENLDRVVGMNYAITPLMPFNGGAIELSAGLLAVAGKNDIKGFLKVLGDFSNLLMVPQLSTALAIATPLANGLSELVGATENHLMLGLHQTWTSGTAGAEPLRAGYFAVILADQTEFDDNLLWVNDGRLLYGTSLAQAQPLRGYNYMLFRLERRDERDDWDSLMEIQEPYNKAIEMLRVGNTDQADAYIRSAKAAAFMANELTRNVDQRRVVTQIQKRYDDARQNIGLRAFSENENPSLSDVMQGALPIAEAKALGSLLPGDVGLEGLVVPDLIDNETEIESVSSEDPSQILAGGGASEPFIELQQWNVTWTGSKESKIEFALEEYRRTRGAPKSFFFALEGEQTKNDAVQFGTNVDLIFDYEQLNQEAAVVLEGRELERARRTDTDLGITVIPKGFAFRSEDGEWYKIARFRKGRLVEPVRFKFCAVDEKANRKATVAAQSDADDSLPILQTGFQIIFEIAGITIYSFPLAVRLVRSIAEVEAATQPRAPLVLNLDKSARHAKHALQIIAEATAVQNNIIGVLSRHEAGPALWENKSR
jgi:hypothetical protein